MDVSFIETLLGDATERGKVETTRLKNVRELLVTGLHIDSRGTHRIPPQHGNAFIYANIAHEGYSYVARFERADFAVETAELIAREASPFAAITVQRPPQ